MIERLANYFVKGPKEATFMTILFACLPGAAMLACAVISMIWLVIGPRQGIKIFIWSLLPSFFWIYYDGNAILLASVISVALITYALHNTKSWTKTSIVLLISGLISIPFLYLMVANQIENIIDLWIKFSGPLLKESGVISSIQELHTPAMKEIFFYTALGFFCFIGMLNAWIGLLIGNLLATKQNSRDYLVLPNYCKNFRFTIQQMLIIFGLGIVLPYFFLGSKANMVMLVSSLPLFLAGITLLHFLIDKRKWLFIPLYISIIFYFGIAYPIVIIFACLDSFLDIGKRAYLTS